MYKKIIITITLFCVIDTAHAIMCHFRPANVNGNSLKVAMQNARNCTSGNESGILIFLKTMAEVLERNKLLSHLSLDSYSTIKPKFLGDTKRYYEKYKLLSPDEQNQVLIMFWLLSARYFHFQSGRGGCPDCTTYREKALTNLQELSRKSKSEKLRKKLSNIDTSLHVKILSKEFNDIKYLIEWPLHQKPYKNCQALSSKKCAQSLSGAIYNIRTCRIGNKACRTKFLSLALYAFEPQLKLPKSTLEKQVPENMQQYIDDYDKFEANKKVQLKFLIEGLLLDHLYVLKKRTRVQAQVMQEIAERIEKKFFDDQALSGTTKYNKVVGLSMEGKTLNLKKFSQNLPTYISIFDAL